MLIMGETLAAGAGEGCCGVGWLLVRRPCDDADDDDGGGVIADADSVCGMSTEVSVAVDDDGDDVASDFTKWSDLVFFGGGASSVS